MECRASGFRGGSLPSGRITRLKAQDYFKLIGTGGKLFTELVAGDTHQGVSRQAEQLLLKWVWRKILPFLN
jgi:hypothetical protein